MDMLTLLSPEPHVYRPRLLPVFLPHAGCPAGVDPAARERCIFCDQRAQTGHGERSLEEHHDALRHALEALARLGGPPTDVGFYGGAFTSLPLGWPERFLALAAAYRERGVVGEARCSARPDACEPELLERLRGLGLSMVELGVQSFSGEALDACRRGHGAAEARQGCAAVRAAGGSGSASISCPACPAAA